MKKTLARKLQSKLQVQRDTVRQLIDREIALVVAGGETNDGASLIPICATSKR